MGDNMKRIIALCLIAGIASAQYAGSAIGGSSSSPSYIESATGYGSKPFLLAVAEGEVGGYSSVNKFGHNPECGTAGEDVWHNGGLYSFYPATAQTVWAQSDSSQDDTGGTGVASAIFYGLDANWENASETVTLDGVTPVQLTNTYVRMFRGVCLTAGSSGSNVGDITVTNSVGTVAIVIGATDGQTQQAIYTIPAGKTGTFIEGYVGVVDDARSGEVANFQWRMRLNNGTTGAWQTKGEMGCNSIGSGWFSYQYGVPVYGIPEKTDIRLFCTETSDETAVVGGFDLLLKDN